MKRLWKRGSAYPNGMRRWGKTSLLPVEKVSQVGHNSQFHPNFYCKVGIGNFQTAPQYGAYWGPFGRVVEQEDNELE